MSIRVFQRNRLTIGIAAILSIVLLAALIVAAISARAESNGEHNGHGGEVTLVSLIGDEAVMEGNVFPDDLSVQYRLKFGEADSGKLGTRRNHVINVQDASTLRMMRLDFPPGTGSPWHTHPQPLVIGVAEGELTVTWATDCEERTYRAGDALVDLGTAIKAVNNSDETAVLYVMALGVPDGVPFTEVLEDFDEPC